MSKKEPSLRGHYRSLHPWQNEVDLYLVAQGFDLADCFSVDENCIRYIFCAESATIVLEMYDFTDENGTTPFVWLQVCAGTVPLAAGNETLRKASEALYRCVWPFRACLIEDQSELLLTLDFRANATAFEPWYFRSLIEAGGQLAEHLVRECSLAPLTTNILAS